jgi:hypothetical protein
MTEKGLVRDVRVLARDLVWVEEDPIPPGFVLFAWGLPRILWVELVIDNVPR